MSHNVDGVEAATTTLKTVIVVITAVAVDSRNSPHQLVGHPPVAKTGAEDGPGKFR